MAPRAVPTATPPVVLSSAEWSAAVALAKVESGDGRDTLIIFTDLECPFCARLDREVRRLKREVTGLQVGVVHFPLREIHRFAIPAAIASECARDQGRFDGFVEVALARQDSVGLLSWGALAARAGVADTARLMSCAKARAHAAVDSGLAMSQRLKLSGTPAIMLNGVLYQETPPPDSLRRLLRSPTREASTGTAQ